jgi:hypothetical protein
MDETTYKCIIVASIGRLNLEIALGSKHQNSILSQPANRVIKKSKFVRKIVEEFIRSTVAELV